MSFGLDIQSSPTLRRFTSSTFEELQYYLKNCSNPAITDSDIENFIRKESLWRDKNSVVFNQKDYVIFSLSRLENELFEYFFETGNRPPLRIELFREVSPQIQQALQTPIDQLENMAARLSQYGTENVPAFISDKMVDIKASSSNSALSSIIAENGTIFEVYRPSNFDNSLIVAHEGFHSAMRRLIFINRQNRLTNLLGFTLGNGEIFDPWIQQYVESLEFASAPHLAPLGIDERFVSDHHGVIMAVIHSNIFQKQQTSSFLPETLNDFVNLYPFNYLSNELSLSDEETLHRMQELHQLNFDYVQTNNSLYEGLHYLSNHLLLYK